MKLNNAHANIIVAIMWLSASVFFFWSLYPYKLLNIEEPIKVLTKEVKAGEDVVVEFCFDKYTKLNPEISIAMVDGVVYNIPTYKPQNEVGDGLKKIVNVLKVPLSIPCGTYHLQWTTVYDVNPIRNIEYKYISEEFRVINDNICNN